MRRCCQSLRGRSDYRSDQLCLPQLLLCLHYTRFLCVASAADESQVDKYKSK